MDLKSQESLPYSILRPECHMNSSYLGPCQTTVKDFFDFFRKKFLSQILDRVLSKPLSQDSC